MSISFIFLNLTNLDRLDRDVCIFRYPRTLSVASYLLNRTLSLFEARKNDFNAPVLGIIIGLSAKKRLSGYVVSSASWTPSTITFRPFLKLSRAKDSVASISLSISLPHSKLCLAPDISVSEGLFFGGFSREVFL